MENQETNDRIKKVEDYCSFLSEQINRSISYSEYLADQLTSAMNFYNGVKNVAQQSPKVDIKIPSFEDFIYSKENSRVIKIQDDFFKQYMKDFCDANKAEFFYIRFTDYMVRFLGFSRIDAYPLCQIINMIKPDTKVDLELGKNVMDFKYTEVQTLEDNIAGFKTDKI